MGDNNGVTEEITNAKLFQAILDLQKDLQKNTENLQKNTESVSQIANNLQDIKQQQDEIKRDFLSFRTNAQASIRALESIQQQLTESQEFINNEFENCKATLKATEDRAKAAESEVVKLTAELKSVHEKVDKDQKSINDSEQYGRRSMLEISSIPVVEHEDLKLIITEIAKCMKLDRFCYEDQVDVAHRLKSKLDIPPIIVLFQSRAKRNNFYDRRKLLKNIKLKDLDIGFQDSNPIFVNESLTLQNAALYKKVRDACKRNRFKFYWTVNGKILCKKSENTATIKIKDENDLQKIR